MERLWAPWRMEYIDSAREGEGGCIFCDLPAEDDDEKNYILTRGDKAFVMLNKFPYNSGHLMIAPFRHMGEVEELENEEALEMHNLLQKSLKALKDAMNPDGFNIGMNLGQVAGAGIPDHVHWHVVPRWSGDTNFMPVVAETKVLPEQLNETSNRLRRQLQPGG
jgi:ATP adenylyltransferase